MSLLPKTTSPSPLQNLVLSRSHRLESPRSDCNLSRYLAVPASEPCHSIARWPQHPRGAHLLNQNHACQTSCESSLSRYFAQMHSQETCFLMIFQFLALLPMFLMLQFCSPRLQLPLRFMPSEGLCQQDHVSHAHLHCWHSQPMARIQERPRSGC